MVETKSSVRPFLGFGTRRALTRRRFLELGVGACLVSLAESAQAVGVPISLQVQLLAKLASYDRNLTARAGSSVLTLVVKKDDDAESSSSAEHALHTFSGLTRIAGLPHAEELISYSGPAALASACASKRAAIVYLMPGVGGDVDSIREALSKLSILSASVVPADVSKGVVVGVDHVSGRPKILINLAQAIQQRVDFSGELLRIATVIR